MAARPLTPIISFDEASRPLTITHPTGGTIGYRYGLDSHQTVISYPASSAVTMVTLTYDADSLRATKRLLSRTDGDDPDTVVTTTYSWDLAKQQPMVLWDGRRSYVWGPQGLLYAVQVGGAIQVPAVDRQGSILALTSITGTVTHVFDNDAFGVPLDNTSEPLPFGYTGEMRDKELGGLVYLRSRHYLSLVGRFTSRDSFGGYLNAPQSQNRYTYAENNPVNRTDPSGHRTPVNPYGCVTPAECVDRGGGPPGPPILPLVPINTLPGPYASPAPDPAAPDQRQDDQRRRQVYHRKATKTQTVDDARDQLWSQEVWGGIPQNGYKPTVQAYWGPLPPGEKGIEFETDVPPASPYGPYAQWYQGDPGVVTRWKEGKEYAAIPVTITRVNYPDLQYVRPGYP